MRQSRPAKTTPATCTNVQPATRSPWPTSDAESHARKATVQTDIVKAALAAAVEELVPIVLENVRVKADAHAALLEQCKALEVESRANLRSAVNAMSMVAPHIAERYGVTVTWQGNAVDQPDLAR